MKAALANRTESAPRPRYLRFSPDELAPLIGRDRVVWDRTLPGFGLRYYASGKRCWIVFTRVKGVVTKRTNTGCGRKECLMAGSPLPFTNSPIWRNRWPKMGMRRAHNGLSPPLWTANGRPRALQQSRAVSRTSQRECPVQDFNTLWKGT